MAAKKNHEAPAPEAEEIKDETVPAAEETETPAPPAEPEKQNDTDRYLRLMAEFDNYKKRSAKERESIFADVRVDTVSKFLPVYDNLERALGTETADEAFKKGVEMTFQQLCDVFQKLGVEPIESVGQTFDPNFHNAVMHVEDEAYGEGEIVEEFQKGFKCADKVIRFSMVKVAN